MTEQEVVRMVQDAPPGPTDFGAPYWVSTDETVLQKCFGKGFIWWVAGRVIVTPLGKRSCGEGVTHERHH